VPWAVSPPGGGPPPMGRSARRSSAPGESFSLNEKLAARSRVGSAAAPAPLAHPCGLRAPGYPGSGRSGLTHGRGHAPPAARPAEAAVRFPGRQARQARGAARWQDLELSPQGGCPWADFPRPRRRWRSMPVLRQAQSGAGGPWLRGPCDRPAQAIEASRIRRSDPLAAAAWRVAPQPWSRVHE
jgi:hypothetical protein